MQPEQHPMDRLTPEKIKILEESIACCVDNPSLHPYKPHVLQEYIMLILGKRKQRDLVEEDLRAFLEDYTLRFVEW